MWLTGNCKQWKHLSGTEISPCLAPSGPELDPKLDFPADLQLCQCDAQHFKRKLECPDVGPAPKSLKVLGEDETITIFCFQDTACPPYAQPLLRKPEGSRNLALKPPAASERREREYFLLALLELENNESDACR